MATAEVCGAIETVDCPICLEQYRQPRELPCQHAFCEDCLKSYILKNVRADRLGHESTFSCPICRKSVSPTNPRSPVSSWVRAFPLVPGTLTVTEPDKQSKDVVHCKMCKVREKTLTVAGVWCVQCEEGLCEKCLDYHQQNILSNKHKIIPVSMAVADSDLTGIDEDCPKHRGKAIEIYCFDHSELCCVICFAHAHRTCERITAIDEVAAGLSAGLHNIYMYVSKQLKKIAHDMSAILKEKERNIKSLDMDREKILRNTTADIEKVKKHIDMLMENFRKEIENKCSEGKAKETERKRQVQAFVKNVEDHSKTFDNLTKISLRHSHKFIISRKILSQMSSQFHQIGLNLATDANIKLEYTRSCDFLEIMKTMRDLGSVELSVSPSDSHGIIRDVEKTLQTIKLHEEIPFSDCKSPLTNLFKLDVMLLRCVTRSDIGLGNVDFSGGTFLADGRLVLCDYCPKANRLVMFDENFGVQRVFKVGGRPYSVTLGRENTEVYVAFRNKKNQVLNVADGSKTEFRTPKATWSIGVCGNVCLVGSDNVMTSIDEHGQITRSIPVKDASLQIATSEKNRKYFYTDGSALVCRELDDGNVVYRYESETITQPMGICLDNQDNLYVCDGVSGIFQIDSSGKRKRKLVNKLHKIKNPWAMMFHPEKELFVVTSSNEDTAFEVYQFIH